MRKNEMTQKQIEERALLIATLSNSGWVGRTTNSLFDEGWWFDAEAVMDYQNAEIELIIHYCAADSSIDFSINQGPNGLDFVIQFEDKLSKILTIILDCQESITLNNYKTYIGEMLQVCPLISIVLNGKVIQLSDAHFKTDLPEAL